MINISLFWYMFIIYQYSCIFSDFDEDIVFVSSVLCNGDQLSWLRTNSLLTLNTTLSLMTCDNSREISQEYQPWNCTDISLYYNHNGIGEQQICRLPQISWPSGTVSDRFVVCHRSRDLLEQSVTDLLSATDLVTFWNSQWQLWRLPQISWPAGTVSDRFVVCYRSRDLLEQSVTDLSSATDLVTCWNSDKYVALKVTRETCYVLALPG